MEDKDKKKIIYTIIAVIVIIIIILLLLSKCQKNDDGNTEPKGQPNNTEIKDKDNNQNKDLDKDKIKNNNDNIEKVNKDIEIKPADDVKKNNSVKKNDTKNSSVKNNNNTSSSNNTDSNNSNNNTSSDDNQEETNEGELSVDWEHNAELKIFSNEYFSDLKIAPGVHGDYSFNIKNNRGNKIKYSISLSDTNTYNINMKYRLKKGNVYVIGDSDTWVDVDEVVYNNQQLAINSNDIYLLEWMWKDSSNDTEIGETDGASYTLTIKVYGEDLSE